MKKMITLLLAAILALTPLTGCGSRNEDMADRMDDMLDDFEYEYSDYIRDKDTPRSVLDALDLMLDHFVSGVSTPSPSSIGSTPLDPDDQEAQDMVTDSGTEVADEAELEQLIYQSLKDIETGVTFTTTGNWLTSDLMYDIVFYRVHDVYMIDAYGLYSYSVKYIDRGNDSVYKLTYTYIDNKTPDEIHQMREDIEDASKRIIRDLGLGGKSDYEIIKAIDQYLCDSVYYPEEPYITSDFTPYGAMIDGRAVCEGYARSVKILCDLCSVDCYFVTGYCNNDPVNGGHAWNLVNVESNWYQLDTTWNDGGSNKDYFLVTDDFMSLSRDWDRTRYPATGSVPYS